MNADVYLTREYTVLYMPLGQLSRIAAALPVSFRLRQCKLLAEVLQAIVGMWGIDKRGRMCSRECKEVGGTHVM